LPRFADKVQRAEKSIGEREKALAAEREDLEQQRRARSG